MNGLELAAARAAAYVEGVAERPVRPDPKAVRRLEALARAPFPQQGESPAAVVETLDAYGSPATVASTGPRYFGFVTGGVLPAALAASWLLDAWDQNGFGTASSPVAAILEQTALAWVLEALDLPRESGGAFVTGATMANFTALAAARHRLLANAGWDVEADGLFGAPPLDVILGEEAHPTVAKSLSLLGLGRERVTRVPVDAQGRLRVEALPPLSSRSIVVAQAGNVNSGAFDPFEALAAATREAGAWLHVDGAFGLWARAAEATRALAVGIEGADSWATDAHKWLNTTYDCGIAVVKDGEALRNTVTFRAPYITMQDARREPCDYTPESSRRARGVEVWAALRSLGREGLDDLISRCCALARRFAAGLRGAGYEVMNDVVLNQVVVAFGDDATDRIIEAVQREGTCWCGPTRWKGRPAMRISVSSAATREADVDRSLAAILRIAATELGREG